MPCAATGRRMHQKGYIWHVVKAGRIRYSGSSYPQFVSGVDRDAHGEEKRGWGSDRAQVSQHNALETDNAATQVASFAFKMTLDRRTILIRWSCISWTAGGAANSHMAPRSAGTHQCFGTNAMSCHCSWPSDIYQSLYQFLRNSFPYL